MPGHTTRARRVADQLRRELAELISREISDPRLRGMLVSDVELSRDLRHATVFMFCPADADQEQCLGALKRAGGFLRRHLARSMQLRQIPELHFKIDTTLEHAAHMDALIARAAPPAETGSETGAHDDDAEDEQ